MSDTRGTASAAWEAYIARKGIAPTLPLIDAFFEGYKDGMTDGVNAGKELTLRILQEKAKEASP